MTPQSAPRRKHERTEVVAAPIQTARVPWSANPLIIIGGLLVAFVVGVLAAKAGGFAGALHVKLATMAVAWAAAAFMGLFSALVPSYNASRLGIVEGLRHIG